MLPGWLQIIMDCNGKMGWYIWSSIQYGAKHLITIAVTSTEEDDDDDNEALIYVKELKKKKILIAEGHSRKWNEGDMIIETLDIDWENVESLKKFRWY